MFVRLSSKWLPRYALIDLEQEKCVFFVKCTASVIWTSLIRQETATWSNQAIIWGNAARFIQLIKMWHFQFVIWAKHTTLFLISHEMSRIVLTATTLGCCNDIGTLGYTICASSSWWRHGSDILLIWCFCCYSEQAFEQTGHRRHNIHVTSQLFALTLAITPMVNQPAIRYAYTSCQHLKFW